jgi:hypothetical protein
MPTDELTPAQLLDQATVSEPMTVAPLAYSQLPEFFEREAAKPHGTSALSQLAGNMQALALRLIRMSVYLEERADYGASHAEAVKEQNKVIKQVRKALGFSRPEHDINF